MNAFRILVVEDHSDSNRVLCGLLTRHGYLVNHALTAREALATAAKTRCHLAIVDIGLPDDNGWNLLGKLRTLAPGLPAIALTGYGQANDFKRSAIVGFGAHLIKPVDWPTLEAAIAKTMSPEKSTADDPCSLAASESSRPQASGMAAELSGEDRAAAGKD